MLKQPVGRCYFDQPLGADKFSRLFDWFVARLGADVGTPDGPVPVRRSITPISYQIRNLNGGMSFDSRPCPVHHGYQSLTFTHQSNSLCAFRICKPKAPCVFSSCDRDACTAISIRAGSKTSLEMIARSITATFYRYRPKDTHN